VSVITPNLDETSLLLGRPVGTVDELRDGADDLLKMGARAVLAKGGHLPGDEVIDVLLQQGEAPLHLTSPRIVTANTHGAGCTLSSAIACYLALGHTLGKAVQCAHAYLHQAMATGADVKTGSGHGPLNHFHAPLPLRKRPA